MERPGDTEKLPHWSPWRSEIQAGGSPRLPSSRRSQLTQGTQVTDYTTYGRVLLYGDLAALSLGFGGRQVRKLLKDSEIGLLPATLEAPFPDTVMVSVDKDVAAALRAFR